MVFGLPGMLYIYCKATSHLTIVRCLRFVLCIASIRFTQSGDLKWGFFDWGRVSTRHNSTPNPDGRCDVSKDDPFLFISLIGGFDENYFSPTPLPSLQQSLITNHLDYLCTFWMMFRFRPFWTSKYLGTPLEGKLAFTLYPVADRGTFWTTLEVSPRSRWPAPPLKAPERQKFCQKNCRLLFL